jgi:acetyl esterase/lipase
VATRRLGRFHFALIAPMVALLLLGWGGLASEGWRAGRLPRPDGRPGGAAPAAQTSPAPGSTVYHDVQYGSADGFTLLLDVYVPDGGPHPAVLLIHGGGWRQGDKADWAPEGERLAAAGFAAFAVNYRLAPAGGTWHAWAPVEDLRGAARWLRANAASYGVDPTKLAALGDSAGGHLALLLGTTGQTGQDRVEAVVSWSGPTELRLLASQQASNAVTNYVGCAPGDCSDLYEMLSPLVHVGAATAPTYLANSTQEIVPLQQATDMAQRLEQAGVPHVLRLLDGNLHARDYEAQVWDESVAFLQTYLLGSASNAVTSGSVGYLEGSVTIGPLQPVERVGVPPPTPSPDACTARGLTIDASDGVTEVTSFNLQPDCTYRVALAPGSYVVRLKPNGIDRTKDLPRTVQIQAGQAVRLDISIDTGIR